MNENWKRVVEQGETMHVDFKCALAWEGSTRASLTKDIVAMSNIRDGGVLVIGVSEATDGNAAIDGVTPEQGATFDPTKVSDYVASWFQPPIKLTVERPVVDGKQLIVIRVSEFEASPIICIKDGPDVVVDGKNKKYFYAGNLFVRSPAAKSEAIRTAEEMHALIRLSVTKTSNQLLADFRRVLDGGTTTAPSLPYERERLIWEEALRARRELWATTYPGLGTITMTFLPSSIRDKLDHAAIRKLVERSQAQWHGYSMPSQTYEDRFAAIQNRTHAVEGTYDLGDYQELWELHDSGAFMFARLLHYVKDGAELRLPFEDVIYAVALGIVFAQRLYQELVPDGQVELEFSLLGTKGQRLTTFDTFMRQVSGTYRSGEDDISTETATTMIDLRTADSAVPKLTLPAGFRRSKTDPPPPSWFSSETGRSLGGCSLWKRSTSFATVTWWSASPFAGCRARWAFRETRSAVTCAAQSPALASRGASPAIRCAMSCARAPRRCSPIRLGGRLASSG